MEHSPLGRRELRKAPRSRRCSPTCSCTTRSTNGWSGSTRVARSNGTRMTWSPTAAPRSRPECYGLLSLNGSGLGPGAAPGQDEGRVLQRREPPRERGAHQLRLPRLYLPGSPGSWTEGLLRELPPSHELSGEEGEGSADSGLAP